MNFEKFLRSFLQNTYGQLLLDLASVKTKAESPATLKKIKPDLIELYNSTSSKIVKNLLLTHK